MLGVLSLGVCIACISCLCCLATATVIAVPELIDLHRRSIMCRNKQQHEGPKRKSENACCPIVEKKISLVSIENTDQESESETCPCVMTWDLVSLLEDHDKAYGDHTKRRKNCKCPSFSQLVGNAHFPSRRLPQNSCF